METEKKRCKLDFHQHYLLRKFIEENKELVEKTTARKLSVIISKDLGFFVSETHLGVARRDMGINCKDLCSIHIAEKHTILARSLAYLYTQMGEKVPEDLALLCE